MPLEKMEQQVRKLVEQDQKDAAVKMLYNLIVEHAKAKNFEKAESLRDQLIELDGMALSEIVNSGDIIESEKSEAIDLNHKQIWSELYGGFSEEEGNAFYFALKEATLAPGKTIIQQGKLNDKLFFINSGTLKAVCLQGDREIFLKEISKGEAVGLGSFFPISIATTSIISIDSVKLHYLERLNMGKIVEKFVGFENKLEGFCKKLEKESAEEILKNKNIDRRLNERFDVAGKVTTVILNSKGERSNSVFYGILEDISVGGISYSIKCSKKETARMLLGRRAEVDIASKKGENGPKESKKGLIVGVQFQLFNDYSIHFKFIDLLPEGKVAAFV